jgi:hypothetical protein
MEALKTALLRTWTEALDAIDRGMDELRADIRAEIAALNPGKSASKTEPP